MLPLLTLMRKAVFTVKETNTDILKKDVCTTHFPRFVLALQRGAADRTHCTAAAVVVKTSKRSNTTTAAMVPPINREQESMEDSSAVCSPVASLPEQENSTVQWYNSRWAVELRAQYQSVGVPWPWTLATACNVDVVDDQGNTALHYAVQRNHDYIVSELLKAGANPDQANIAELTPLHLAAGNGLLSVLDTLLKNGACINSRTVNHSTPLHLATDGGHTTIVEKLCIEGGRVNSLDNSERTPLILAAMRGNLECLNVLLCHGSPPNVHDTQDWTAMSYAVERQDVAVVERLLSAGASPLQTPHLLHRSVRHRNLHITKLLLNSGAAVNKRSDDGDAPMLIAARNCSSDIVKLLLQHGADPNIRHGVHCGTALHCVVEATIDDEYEEFVAILSLLLKAGAKMNVAAQITGDTPLFRAVLLQKGRAVELFLKHGCSVRVATPVMGVELLRVAVYGNNKRMVMLLILAGCPLYPCIWLNNTFPTNSLHDIIAAIRKHPFRLSELCRMSIRELLGDKLMANALQLPLPALLQRSLLLPAAHITEEDLLKHCTQHIPH
uniref:Ankyrin-1-like n=1 Tax=Hirondellea gigas TaxID=1518452 RepID=A0A6A7FX52_9CRUS